MSFLWPFTTRTPAQENRVDQGWDLAGTAGAPILAVASGTVGMAPPDPSGFGPDYPTLLLDSPPPGSPSHTLYYGHTDVNAALVGRHVNAGDVIGTTAPQGHNSPPGWLEIGFARDGTGAPAPGGGGFIKSLLSGAAATAGTTPGGATATNLSSPITPVLNYLAGAAGLPSGASIGHYLMIAVGATFGLVLIVLGAERATGAHPAKTAAGLAPLAAA